MSHHASSSSSSSSTRHTVVIVGASFAGARCAMTLHDTRLHVVLIEQKDYYEFNPSVLRALAHPSHISTILFPLSECRSLSHVTLMHTRVTGFDAQHVYTATGESVKYDTLVIATGTGYANAIKPSFFSPSASSITSRRQELHDHATQIANANRITIIGGGLVGVEFAAEIAYYHPTKQCTLCIRPNQLLPGFPKTAQTYTHRWMIKHNVTIKEQNIKPSEYKAASDELIFDCTGTIVNPLPNTSRMQPSPSPSTSSTPIDLSPHTDGRGHILVDRYCRIPGYNHIYAIGDCMIHPSRQYQTAYTAELAAVTLARNIIHELNGEEIQSYPEGIAKAKIPVLICCSLGPRDGFLQFNDLVITGYFASFNKWLVESVQIKLYRGDTTGNLWHVIEPSALLANRMYRWMWEKENVGGEIEMTSQSQSQSQSQSESHSQS